MPHTDTANDAKQPAGDRHNQPIDARTIGRRLRVTTLAAMTVFCACATSRGSSPKPAPALAQSEGHIYVTSGGLGGACYRDLGQLTLNESYAQSVVGSGDSQAQQLRELAREKYPGQVDAVINVREQQNEAGTAVEVIGEAVQIQKHETVVCAARGMPGVVDAASTTAAGGIVGTLIGGLVGGVADSGVTGAEMGGATGATAAVGIQLARHRQQQHAEEVFISDRLEQQQNEITQLRQQLAKLMKQQCDTEQLSAQDCNQQIAAAQQPIAKPAGTADASATTGATAEFQVRNHMQEQQETIDQLRQRIAQIKQSMDNQ